MALSLSWITARVRQNQYIITRHAETERRNDALSIAQMEEALVNGVILEDYPDDPRGSSCLIYGRSEGKDIHIVCKRNADDWMVIITVYVPAWPKWKTPTERNRP